MTTTHATTPNNPAPAIRTTDARRETMLPLLLGELRRRRRRQRTRRAMVGLASALLFAAVGTAWFQAGPAAPNRAPVTPGPLANTAPPREPQPPSGPALPRPIPPDARRPLIAVVGTAPGLAERWGSAEPRVRVVRVSDEQLLAALNERGPRYGLVRIDGAAALVPLRSP